MYKTISQIPKEELNRIKNNSVAWGIVLRDADSEDFQKVVCRNAKKVFTKENLISEINEIESLPNYVILPDRFGDIHVIYYGRSSLSIIENEKMDKIFKEVFGVVNYI